MKTMLKITGLSIEIGYCVFTIYMMVCYGFAVLNGSDINDLNMGWEITLISMIVNSLFVTHLARLAIQSWREGRKSK